MAEVIYLSPGEAVPEAWDDRAWLIVEASDDGRFFGTGSAWKPSGEWVGYCSLAENDHSLETALAAAQQWAAAYGVPEIWVQAIPEDGTRQ